VPAVLEIHGGPRALYGDGIFHEFQVLAGEGMAVIYTNSRGSAGYEEAFTKGVMRHYGEGDYEDIMACCGRDFETLRIHRSEPSRCMWRQLRGYMTNWIVTQTTRFRAAVTFRSVCNWVSKFGTSGYWLQAT